MKKIMLAAFALIFILGSSGFGSVRDQVTFKWFGQACFLIVTSQGTQIITDPVEMGEYKIPKDIVPDIVTVSHEHMDHNKVASISGNPEILKGLTPGENEAANIVTNIKDVHIHTVASYHDNSQGSQRGLNAIFVFDFDGIRIAHLGDLGHSLSEEQLDKMGDIDVLMIPVGGKYTVFGKEADRIIAQLKPRFIVFPIHFKTDNAQFLPHSGDDFVLGKTNVKKVSSNTYTLDLKNLPENMEYVVLNYK